jgi:hypothetical protein
MVSRRSGGRVQLRVGLARGCFTAPGLCARSPCTLLRAALRPLHYLGRRLSLFAAPPRRLAREEALLRGRECGLALWRAWLCVRCSTPVCLRQMEQRCHRSGHDLQRSSCARTKSRDSHAITSACSCGCRRGNSTGLDSPARLWPCGPSFSSLFSGLPSCAPRRSVLNDTLSVPSAACDDVTL